MCQQKQSVALDSNCLSLTSYQFYYLLVSALGDIA